MSVSVSEVYSRPIRSRAIIGITHILLPPVSHSLNLKVLMRRITHKNKQVNACTSIDQRTMRRGIRVFEWKRHIWEIQSREHNEDDAKRVTRHTMFLLDYNGVETSAQLRLVMVSYCNRMSPYCKLSAVQRPENSLH